MKAAYFRGNVYLSESDANRIKAIWEQEYKSIQFKEIDNNTGTGIHELTELLYTIWNNNRLNERETAIIERIKKTLPKGLTPSSGYYSHSVEGNLLNKLFLDAYHEFCKITDEPFEISHISFNEILRLYGMPIRNRNRSESESIIDKVAEVEKYISLIGEPKKIIEYESYYPTVRDFGSGLKCYYIKGKFDYKPGNIYKEFPFLGKLHQCHDYFQLNVYDSDFSDKAMQCILNKVGYSPSF